MKTIDVRLPATDMANLQAMIGKRLDAYKRDSFLGSGRVYGIVGLRVKGDAWTFTNFIEVADYYGADEDVAIFRMQRVAWDDIRSCFPSETMTVTPVGRVISSIDVVNERQNLFVGEVQTYAVCLTRGIVFKFDDGSELSFEKSIWFSEIIAVKKGCDLVQSFSPTDEFVESWEDDHRGECSREIVELRG